MSKILFICSFGQSRSRWFAEKFMDNGIKAQFCGYDKEATPKLENWAIDWADIIVILDKHFSDNVNLIEFPNFSLKEVIHFHIEDKPYEFHQYLFNNQKLRDLYYSNKDIKWKKEWLEE